MSEYYPSRYGVYNAWGMIDEISGAGTLYTREDSNLYFWGFPQISAAVNHGFDATLKFSYIVPMSNEAGSYVIWKGVVYPVTNWWTKALKVWNGMTATEKRLLARDIFQAGGDTYHIRGFMDPGTNPEPDIAKIERNEPAIYTPPGRLTSHAVWHDRLLEYAKKLKK